MTENKELKDGVIDLAKAKIAALSIWQEVQWVGGRLHVETNNIIQAIKSYPEEYKLLYLETIANAQFTVQDNTPFDAPDITTEFKTWVKGKILELKIQHVSGKTNAQLNKIPLATRRNILDGFLVTKMSWYGQLDQIGFLTRLYELAKMPSTDDRYNTAEEDIYKHTVLNYDWPDEWVFTDSRFNLMHTTDQAFLEFLCMTLHPVVRSNPEETTTLLEIYNNNLKPEGFVLDIKVQIANRPVYAPAEWQNKQTVASAGTTGAPVPTTIRKALIIGCSTYDYANRLTNPVNDANGMEAVLKSIGFKVTKVLDPGRRTLKMAMDEFGESLKGSDVGLFYFAGHGIQCKGQNYLVPVDASLKSEQTVEYDCVEAGRVLAHMEAARTSVNLIILDACRDNPFERSWSRGTGQRGLATMNAPRGSLIAYATAPGSTASDGAGTNGLYTSALLNHIYEKNDAINSMFQKVRREVMEKSRDEQVPWEATSLTDDFYFNK